VLTGAAKPEGSVIVYDDNGAHAGVSVAEFAARAGANVDYVTPERSFAPDVGATSAPPYLRAFSDHNVSITLNLRWSVSTATAIASSRLSSTNMAASASSGAPTGLSSSMAPCQRTILYFELKSNSCNLGEVDHPPLIASRAQACDRNPLGAYQLFRIGDAVASRNIHAAVYDALRLVRVM